MKKRWLFAVVLGGVGIGTIFVGRLIASISQDLIAFATPLALDYFGQHPEVTEAIRRFISTTKLLTPYMVEYLVFVAKKEATVTVYSWVIPSIIVTVIGLLVIELLARRVRATNTSSP